MSLSFDLPEIVVKTHEQHRWNVAGQPTNVFNPDYSNNGQNNAYFQTVLSVAGILFAFGAILFIFLVIGDISACCCCRNKKKAGSGGFCSKLFSARLWYILSVLAAAGLFAASLGIFSSFKGAVDDSVTNLLHFNSLLTNSSNTVNNQLVPALSNITVTASRLIAQAQSNSDPALLLDALYQIGNGTVTANSSAGTAATQLNNTAYNVNMQLTGGHFDINELGEKVNKGGLSALGVFLAFLLLTVVTLMGYKWCGVLFRGCTSITVILIFFIFLFAGFFAVFSMVLSDVCVAPGPSVQAILNQTQITGDVVDTVRYYTSCNATPGVYVPPSGAYAKFDNARQQAITAQGQIANFSANNPDATLQPLIDSLWMQLNSTQNMFTSLDSDIGCTPIYSTYVAILRTLCTTGASAIIRTWILATATAALMTILGISGFRMCAHHPSDDTPAHVPMTPTTSATMSGGAQFTGVQVYEYGAVRNPAAQPYISSAPHFANPVVQQQPSPAYHTGSAAAYSK